jgi:hypothetical protein
MSLREKQAKPKLVNTAVIINITRIAMGDTVAPG